MAKYENITREQMEALLIPQGFHALALPAVKELVYAKRVDADSMNLSLRVFTGIDPSGTSRAVGKDAMHCVLFWRRPDGTILKVASSKRVHRVKGWRENLQERIDTLRPGPRCPDCNSPMVRRKSARGEFYGCATYPVCKHTTPIEGEK